MSNVSKLVIKACSDNKFSSFSGEFITSINPENLTIKSAVFYHVPQGMANATLLKYRGSPPKLLSFSLLFDTTGMIPGSNAIPVMEQVKQLQDVAYNVHKKNNAPNYIRIIWGQIDFKGRLVDLDIVYSMFQVDGTLVRAEAHLSVLEELVSLGKGKSAAGVDGNYAKPSGASATSKQRAPLGQGSAGQDGFAATPNGMNGPYSGAPPGAYDGGPDQVYQGSNNSGEAVYASPAAGKDHAGNPTATVKPSGSSRSDADVSSGSGTGYANTDLDHSDNGLKGGVAGNGPGGSGGGVGGGGHGPGGDGAKSGGGTAPTNSQREAGSSPARAPKSQGAPVPAGGKASAAGGLSKTAAGAALGAASATGGLAAAASGLNSLRGKVDGLTAKGKLLKLLQRVKNFAKKTAPRAYDAGKKAVKKI